MYTDYTMKIPLLLVLLSINIVCYSQAYKETIAKCTQTFQSGLNISTTNELESKMEQQMIQLRKCLIGLKFPAFKATTIDSITVTPDDLKGKIVLINLWFINCAPCVAEIPMFNELQNTFSRQDFVILSFGLDDMKSIKAFLEKHPVNFNVFANSKELIANEFRMSFGYPTNIFLDMKGQIIEFKTGGAVDGVGLSKTKEEFKSLIEKQLSH